MKNEFKYNFVFFFARDDYWKAILGKELYEHPQVKVYEDTFDGCAVLKKIFRFHWSYRINKKINLPLKRLWFRKMYNQKFDDILPLCFVYMGGNSIYYDGGFTSYVRKQSKDNRQIILHNDLISKKCTYNYFDLLKRVDMATTYDIDEANKYGIQYFREITYSTLMPISYKNDYQYDVYFLGAVKDRLEKIMEVYKYLTGNGIRCLFMLSGVPKDKQEQGNGLQYVQYIPYVENIRNVLRSKCVLEVIQGGSVDITTRALEAVAYRRKLISNCTDIAQSTYYRPEQMNIFSSVEDIDIEFIRGQNTPENYIPLIDMNPLNRLYFFQEKLEEVK